MYHLSHFFSTELKLRSTYITLQLAGIARVSDIDVILQPLQSDHLPFGLLKFFFVLLLKLKILRCCSEMSKVRCCVKSSALVKELLLFVFQNNSLLLLLTNIF